jgi:hypothetical protein
MTPTLHRHLLKAGVRRFLTFEFYPTPERVSYLLAILGYRAAQASAGLVIAAPVERMQLLYQLR